MARLIKFYIPANFKKTKVERRSEPGKVINFHQPAKRSA
jgi:hypothetical protein